MTRFIPLRAGALAVLLAAALGAAGCGSDSGDGAATGATTTTPATSGSAATPTATAIPAATELCDDNQEPNGLDYAVVKLPAGDLDGGLVVLADAGVGNARLAVLPSGTTVITTNDPATCAVVADGGVWWKVDDGSGLRGWVNSRYLTRTAAQEAATRVEICRLYGEVVGFENGPGGFAPKALTAELDAALNAPPPGVSDALERISSPADEADLAEAYTSLKGYVGPLCP